MRSLRKLDGEEIESPAEIFLGDEDNPSALYNRKQGSRFRGRALRLRFSTPDGAVITAGSARGSP